MNFIKETDLEETSIGKIPKEWKVASLRAVSEIRSNKGINGADKIAFIPMELVSDSEPFVKYQLRKRGEIHSFTYCQAGDLLLAKITPSLENGKQGIVPLDVPNGVALATTEVFPIHTSGVDTLFLFYVLKHTKFRNKIIASMIGTTGRQRASKESIERLEIPLPTTEEQKRIANVLSDVDSTLELADRVIAKTERLKKGLMQQLLTHGIGHSEYEETPIGKIPKDWEITTIDKECSVGTGGTPSRNIAEYFGGKISWAKSTEVDYGIITKTEETLTEEGLQNSNAKVYPAGSLVMALYGQGTTRGKCAILGIDAAINQACAVLQSKGRIHIPYLFYWCQNSYSAIRGLSQGANQANLNMGIIRSLEIPLPGLSEQKMITEILLTIDNKLKIEKSEKTKTERIKQGLMNLLLTGKVRIKVD
jgi:type I restriction enzyme S subunit